MTRPSVLRAREAETRVRTKRAMQLVRDTVLAHLLAQGQHRTNSDNAELMAALDLIEEAATAPRSPHRFCPNHWENELTIDRATGEEWCSECDPERVGRT